jgi:hypothetical protein
MVLRAAADSAPLRHWPANCILFHGTEAIVRTQRVCTFLQESLEQWFVGAIGLAS